MISNAYTVKCFRNDEEMQIYFHVFQNKIQHGKDWNNLKLSCLCWVSLTVYCALQWHHNERGFISNHQPHNCLLNRLFKVQIKEISKLLSHWPLCGEFTGDLWIPCTKGQKRGKCFHFMMSSWYVKPGIRSETIMWIDNKATIDKVMTV